MRRRRRCAPAPRSTGAGRSDHTWPAFSHASREGRTLAEWTHATTQADRHPHRRRRRAGPQLGHQERGVSVHRARLRGDRHSPWLGGPHPPHLETDGSPIARLRAPARPARTRAPSTAPVARSSTPRARIPRACRATACRPASPTRTSPVMRPMATATTSRPSCSTTSGGSASTPSSRSVATTRSATAHRLGREGVPLVAIPKTMDNDVQGTEYCIGFSTAVTRAKELINRQRTTLGSHERIGVFRIFGRNAGYTAWYAAYVTSARCVIPEAPFDLDALAGVLADDRRAQPVRLRVRDRQRGRHVDRRRAARRSATPDAYGHRHKADVGYALADRAPAPDRDRDGEQRPHLRPAQRAIRTRSTRWSRSRSPTSPWTCWPTA